MKHLFEPFFTTKEVENQLAGMTFTVILPLVGVLKNLFYSYSLDSTGN